MEARVLGASAVPVSAIGFDVTGASAGGRSPESMAAQGALLKAAYDRGVRLFDTTFATEPEATQRFVLSTLANSGPDAQFVTGIDPADLPSTSVDERGPTGVGLEKSRSPRSTQPRFAAILLRNPGEKSWDGARVRRGLESLVDSAVTSTWGAAWDDARSAEAGAARAIREGATVLSFPSNLLDFHALEAVAVRARDAGVSIVLRNAHADGRLDGRFLREGWTAPGRDPRPLELASFRAEYAPVLRLSVLTEGGKRTLGQAAIAFALTEPRVASVVVPFRSVSLIDELVSAPSFRLLSDDEREHLSQTSVRTP